MSVWKTAVCLWIFLPKSVQSDENNRTISDVVGFRCLTYNRQKCKSDSQHCETIQSCQEPVGGIYGCYAVWNEINGHSEVALKGCWDVVNECHDSDCVATEAADALFCCCKTPMCNANVSYDPTPPSPVTTAAGLLGTLNAASMWKPVFYSLVPVSIVAGVVFIAFWSFHRRKMLALGAIKKSSLQLRAPTEQFRTSDSTPLNSIQLLEIKAKTQRGCVWRGEMPNKQLVAVKIISSIHWDIWARELEIHSLLGAHCHPNILAFIGGGEMRPTVDVGDVQLQQLWIVTAYQPLGGLNEFLENNEVGVSEALRLSLGFIRGLAFLHEERHYPSVSHKSSIVHRDVKSPNVLVTSDQNAVISDFGLALRCEDGHVPSDTNCQVGTLRYWAPEVLEGATDNSAFAFRQIDVYAASLVLWEILSRCRVTEASLDAYQQPYAGLLGQSPSVLDVQTVVVTQKKRPTFSHVLTDHPILSGVTATIEEMWDLEPEARITVGCAAERLELLLRSSLGTEQIEIESTPLITERD